MKKYYRDDRVLIRKNFKMGIIVSSLEDPGKYLVSYYIRNKLVYDVIELDDIIDEEEYDTIKKRINLINKIIK